MTKTAEEIDFVADFEDALNSDDMTPDEVCMKFFGQADTSCPIIEEGYSVADIEYLQTEGGILIRIRKRPDLLTSDQQEIIDSYHLYVYRNEEEQVVLDLVPTKFFSYEEEVKEDFQVLLERASDENYTTEEVCALLSEDSQEVCGDLRRLYLGNQPTILSVKTIYIDGIAHVQVEVEYNEGDQLLTQTYLVAIKHANLTYQQVLYIEASD